MNMGILNSSYLKKEKKEELIGTGNLKTTDVLKV